VREQILQALRKHRYVSGERLGKELKISRSAVWKHIRELRSKGYKIKSSPRLGYYLVSATDLIIPEEISCGLKTRFIGQQIIYRAEVSSTQQIAGKYAVDKAKEGTAVIAESQTEGKGRKGRTWLSPGSGGIYISIILRPDIKPVNAVQIPLVVGVALAEAIRKSTSLDARIKWPNDIYINNKKICGILAEISCELDTINHIIMGIGINANTKMSELPPEIQEVATSISAEYGKEINRAELIKKFFTELEKVYSDFIENGFNSARKKWKKLTNTLGARVKIMEGDNEIKGKALDIDEEGFLVFQSDSGEITHITGGDVSLRVL
jgi:BirA family transcriptional regulator, biotin operon repressor / biotin---[acetyl-CoA-carboxylase] ligase